MNSVDASASLMLLLFGVPAAFILGFFIGNWIVHAINAKRKAARQKKLAKIVTLKINAKPLWKVNLTKE